MVFSRGKVRNTPDVFFGNVKLEVVFDYTYLGITFSYNGLLNRAIANSVEKAMKAKFSLLVKARSLQLPADVMLDLFEKTIVPVLVYGSELWGLSNLEHIEVFHRKFLRTILKVAKTTPNCMIYGKTGQIYIRKKVDNRMLCFWYKTLQGKREKISYLTL